MSVVSSSKGTVVSGVVRTQTIQSVNFTVYDVTVSFPQGTSRSFFLPPEAAADVRVGDSVTVGFDELGQVQTVTSKSGKVWAPPLLTVR